MITEKMKNIVFYLKKSIDNKMRKYDLTTVQVLILKYLKDNIGKEVIQKDICDHLSLKHSTVISILKRLEDKELVSKETSKNAVIRITKKGIDLSEKIGIKNSFIEDKLLDGFTEEEINVLSKQLDRIYENVKNNI